MKGFTLVEVLVVIAIIAVMGVILVAIFINTLRGSNKSQILSMIKQNGQAVLENMGNNIRDADKIVCISENGDTLVVVKKGDYYRYRFVPKNNTDNAKGNCGSSNGCIQEDYPDPEQPVGGEQRDIKGFVTSVCADPLVSPITLTDTNTQTGVSVEGSFSVDSLTGYKTAVGVNFILSPGVEALPYIVGEIEPVEFKTTITLR